MPDRATQGLGLVFTSFMMFSSFRRPQCGMHATRAFSAGDLGAQRIERRSGAGPQLRQPVLELHECRRIHLVHAMVPIRRTVVKPLSRSTFRCCDTAGCEIPYSDPTTATISPAEDSPAASSSRIRRRTGSASTSNPCTLPLYKLMLIFAMECLPGNALPVSSLLPRLGQ